MPCIKIMVRRYPILRQRLKEIRMSQDELAKYLGRSRVCITNKMTGHGSFTLDEARRIMEVTGLRGKTIDEVFGD